MEVLPRHFLGGDEELPFGISGVLAVTVISTNFFAGSQ
jgi:hypothetical protein